MAVNSLDHRYLRRSLWLLGLALCSLILMIALFVSESRKIINANQELNRINGLLPSLRSSLELMLDAETGQRGFMLTGDREYLEPYHRANAEIDAVLGTARLAVGGYGPEWVAQVEGLIDLKRQKFAEMEQTLHFVDAGDTKSAMALVRRNNGLVLMEHARGVLDSMIQELQEMRTDIMAKTALALLRAQVLMVAVSLSLVCAVALATWLLTRILKENDELSVRLAREATHDNLTGLPNRRLLDEMLPTLIEQGRRRSSIVGALYLDLDGFKRINDELGHAAGDSVLRLVAERAFRVLRHSDVLARLGGDEFVVVVTDVGTRGALQTLAQRLLAEISRPLPESFGGYPIGASVGIATFPDHADNAEQLISAADGAMYIAKRSGKGRICFSDSEK